MLTADLVPARVRDGVLRPVYVDPSKEGTLEVARALIALFEESVGEPRRVLDERLSDYTGNGTEFVLHRGLARLLEARGEFSVESPVEPAEMRRAVFEASAAAWGAAEVEDRPFHFERKAVLERAAAALGLEAEALETCLFADLKSEQSLITWESCEPEWLLHRYNVALAQGLLLRAAEMRLELGRCSAKRQREVFRRLKFFRLLFRVEEGTPGKTTLLLDGPLSLFSASQRYGLQMASFLPALLHMEKWKLEARVMWGKDRTERIFRLSPRQGLVPHGRLRAQWQPEELQGFLERFRKVGREWSISEDAPLITLPGQGLLLPDFLFTHEPSGFEVSMEALGYWRRGAVDARLDLLAKGVTKPFVLALSQKLATDRDKLEKLPQTVYVYRTRPVAKDVLEILETLRS